MTRRIVARLLTPTDFAPFGQVIEAAGAPDRIINAGRCGRFHDRARPEIEGRTGISVFRSETVALPYSFTLVERHPLGSQAFLPMAQDPFLVIVVPDAGGRPGAPLAFVAAPGQGINIGRNVWHGVLTPLAGPGLFAVVDRCDEGPNLEEYLYDEPWTVVAG
ncbi:ureidoglycolate lyase [Paracoccus marinus]|uniref:ureidoglycolate lyase n=1 Tax=Paracoccus marinus TaxID=288426 RepID=UPI001FE6D6F7|nr:ureidoglycolate lyase [Paracoccus marinus]GLS80888.1 ureidoglycolate lyase [Paracoccus marinus]